MQPAKAYIFDFDPARIRAQTGAAVVGSSNLSLGGVTRNTWLKTRVFGAGTQPGLARWFDEPWETAEDFDEDVIHELRRSSAPARFQSPMAPALSAPTTSTSGPLTPW